MTANTLARHQPCASLASCYSTPEDGVTFEEVLAHGRRVATTVNGFPWNFEYHGFMCKHVEDDLYTLSHARSPSGIKIRPGDRLYITQDRVGLSIFVEHPKTA